MPLKLRKKNGFYSKITTHQKIMKNALTKLFNIFIFICFIIFPKISDLCSQEKNTLLETDSSKATINFSASEMKWLKMRIVITYSEINWKPLSIIENNSMTGLMGDYLKIVSRHTGIKFKYIPSATWPEVLAKFSRGEIDLVPGIGDSADEKKMGLISDMYVKYPMVIVTNDNLSYVDSLDEIKGKVFSIPKYYTSYNHIKNKYPEAKIIETRSIAEALHNVNEKKADIYVGHLVPALYYITRLNTTSLRIIGKTDFDFRHHYLIQPKHRVLTGIVNKVFATITVKQKEKIYHDWVHVEVKSGFDYTLFWQISIIVVVIILFFVFNTKKLRSMVAAKTEEITILLDAYDRSVLASKTDTNGIFTYVSKAFCKISGYTQDELIGKSHRIMRHPDMSNNVLQNLSSTVKSNKIWKGEIKNLTKNNDFFWAEVIISPEYDKSGKINGYSAIRQDITAKKALEQLSANLENIVTERTKELQEATRVISKSIDFAAIIQKTFSFKQEDLKHFFADYFVILKQKNVVGGDIVIFEKINENECLLMVIDCTGHGVPGAFVTMIVKTLSRQIIGEIRSQKKDVSTSNILQKFNYEIKHLLNQTDRNANSNVGFDGQILYYNRAKNNLKFSSARSDLIIYNKKFTRIRGDRHSVGYRDSDINFTFKEFTIPVEPDTIIYVYSDGITDQLGGPKEIPFGFTRTREILENCKEFDMHEQKKQILQKMNEYRKEHEQNDDIAFVGLKIKKY